MALTIALAQVVTSIPTYAEEAKQELQQEQPQEEPSAEEPGESSPVAPVEGSGETLPSIPATTPTETPEGTQEEEAKEGCCHTECENYDGSPYYCSKCNFNVISTVSNRDGITHTETFYCKGCPDAGTQSAHCYFTIRDEEGNKACYACGQIQKYTVCAHEACETPVTEHGYCDECRYPKLINVIVTGSIAEGHYEEYHYTCCGLNQQGLQHMKWKMVPVCSVVIPRE